MARILITAGVIFIVAGLTWPLLSKIAWGRLPGDIVIEKAHWSFYLPLATSALLSIVLSMVIWLLQRLG